MVADNIITALEYSALYGVTFHYSWKDLGNPFRTNLKLKISGVPTLMEWDTVSQY